MTILDINCDIFLIFGKKSKIEILLNASKFLYPTKKKRNSKIFPLSFPFNAKMLIVINI